MLTKSDSKRANKKSDNVVSLRERMERWAESYSSPMGDVRISTSNHGRIKFVVKGESCTLDFTEGVKFLSQVSVDVEDTMKQ